MASYEEIRGKCDIILSGMKKLDYKSLKAEVNSACKSAKISDNTMTPNDLAADMEIIQAARDRVIEIFADAQEAAIVKKDVSKMMIAAAKKSSAETSSDKRDADAAMKASKYILESTEAEAFLKYCDTMYAGLNNKYNSVGKRIACMQEAVRISQFGGSSSMVSDMAMPRSTSGKFDAEPPRGGVAGSTQETDWDNL